jgi:endonuclease III
LLASVSTGQEMWYQPTPALLMRLTSVPGSSRVTSAALKSGPLRTMPRPVWLLAVLGALTTPKPIVPAFWPPPRDGAAGFVAAVVLPVLGVAVAASGSADVPLPLLSLEPQQPAHASANVETSTTLTHAVALRPACSSLIAIAPYLSAAVGPPAAREDTPAEQGVSRRLPWPARLACDIAGLVPPRRTSARGASQGQLALAFEFEGEPEPAAPPPSRAKPLPRPVTTQTASLRERALDVHRRLVAAYGPARHTRADDPLSELVRALLSQRTRHEASSQAFAALKARFGTWAAVRDAPCAEVEATIAACTWPEQKAPRLQAVLRAIEEQTGSLSLDLLESKSLPEGQALLESLPGVGPKTAAAVMLFSTLRRAAMPVDCHHHRVALRLGLIPDGTEQAPAHPLLRALLPETWGHDELHDHHLALKTLGKLRCFPKKPDCPGCPAADLCPEALRARSAGQAAPGGGSVDVSVWGSGR